MCFFCSVQYKQRQDPKLLSSGSFARKGLSHIALSPDNYTVAVASESTVYFFAKNSGELLETVEHAHAGSWKEKSKSSHLILSPEPITALTFDPESKYLMTASSDKVVHIWHNAPGMQEKVGDLLTWRIP